jgi:hypothetical protein
MWIQEALGINNIVMNFFFFHNAYTQMFSSNYLLDVFLVTCSSWYSSISNPFLLTFNYLGGGLEKLSKNLKE